MMNNFKTTFWNDFSIADKFGIDAIKDTAKRAFDEWHTNTEYITEFVIVLNWKLWQHYEDGNMEVAKVYDGLWKQYNTWCLENLKDDDLKYFIEQTD